jgi:hypothetical protein
MQIDRRIGKMNQTTEASLKSFLTTQCVFTTAEAMVRIRQVCDAAKAKATYSGRTDDYEVYKDMYELVRIPPRQITRVLDELLKKTENII